MSYSYRRFGRPFSPEDSSELEKENVLGIEVTIPSLAALCRLGNLDHHGPGSSVETPSAVRQAMIYTLPPDGTTLVTVRPDADSVGAMAVLANRAEGREVDESIVNSFDFFDRLGPASGRPVDAVVAIVAKIEKTGLGGQLGELVAWVQSVLDGTVDQKEITDLVQTRDLAFATARANSRIEVVAGDRVAVVVSTHRFAPNLGYERASVVVCMNPEQPIDFRNLGKGTYIKFSVCRYDANVPVDMKGVLDDLMRLELERGGNENNTWGGTENFLGSPQGESSLISLDEVVAVVTQHLR